VTPVAKSAQSPFANVTGRPVRSVTSKELLRSVRDEGRHVRRARFGALIVVAYHAPRGVRDERLSSFDAILGRRGALRVLVPSAPYRPAAVLQCITSVSGGGVAPLPR
jgi:hypothetical protein